MKCSGLTISRIFWTWPIYALARRGSHDRARGTPEWFSRLKLLVMTVKQMAASGHLQAIKLFYDIPPSSEKRESKYSDHGFLIEPQKLTEEEWDAMRASKNDPPNDNGEVED